MTGNNMFVRVLLLLLVVAGGGGTHSRRSEATTCAYDAIPADAVRITTDDLLSDKASPQLRQLMAAWTPTDQDAAADAIDAALPPALRRLLRVLRAAEQRKKTLESSGRLLSINRGGFFRGCKSYLILLYTKHRVMQMMRECVDK